MDAISFVLGEKATSLRVKKLGDLIHGAPVGKPVANKCSVTMNYQDDRGKFKAFTRSVTAGGSEFKIDGKVGTSLCFAFDHRFFFSFGNQHFCVADRDSATIQSGNGGDPDFHQGKELPCLSGSYRKHCHEESEGENGYVRGNLPFSRVRERL